MKSVLTEADRNDDNFALWRAESGVFVSVMDCIGREALRNLCTTKVQFEGRNIRVMILDENEGERLAMSPLRRFYVIKKDGTVQRYRTVYGAALDGWSGFENFANKILEELYKLGGQKQYRQPYSHEAGLKIHTFYEDLRTFLSVECPSLRTAILDSLIGILELVPHEEF